MSHWQKSKLNLKCSLDVLKKALSNIMPQWAEHIQVDPSGNLTIHNSHTDKTMSGYAIKIPHSDEYRGIRGAPGIRYADIGIKKNDDGTWGVEADVGYLKGIENLDGEIRMEVAMMKEKAKARLKGLRIVNEDREGDVKSITVDVPVGGYVGA